MKKLILGVWLCILLVSACKKDRTSDYGTGTYDMECMERTPYNRDSLGHFLVDTVTFSAVWELFRLNDNIVILNDSFVFESSSSGLYVSYDILGHATMAILNNDSVNISIYAPGHFSTITDCKGVRRN